MKKIILPVLLLCAAGVGWWILRPTSSGPQSRPLSDTRESSPRATATAERRDLEFSIDLSGDIIPASQVAIKPEVGGKIKKLHVDAGDTVRKGDLLVEIDDTDLLREKETASTEVAGARLTVERERRNFDRTQELFKSRLVSRETFDNAKSLLEIAENALQKSESHLRSTEERLQKTLVLAPSDGTVLSCDVQEGQVVVAAASVNSGTLLLNLANLSSLIIQTHVNQVDIAHIKPGMAVRFRSDALEARDMEAIVRFIAPVATLKNNVKGFQVEALIKDPNPALRPGMTVVMTALAGHAENAVTVPISAVFNDPAGGRIVYVNQNNSPRKRAVDVGLTNIEFAEIRSGVEPGEEVLLSPPGAPRAPGRS